MKQRDYEKEAEEYKDKILSNIVPEETLTNDEHKLLVEECCCEELIGIYDNLKDLEIADLCDFFALERRDGRI